MGLLEPTPNGPGDPLWRNRPAHGPTALPSARRTDDSVPQFGELGQVFRADVTNIEVGRMVELSVAQISRLRSGKRTPSIATIHKFALVLGWDVRKQHRALRNGDYHTELEWFLHRKKEKEQL